jgi:hypothetical protein
MAFQEVTFAVTVAAVTVEKEISALFFSETSSHNSSHGSYTLWIWTSLLLLGLYTFVSLLTNAVSCYQFLVAWNLISRAHRMDLEMIHHHKDQFMTRRTQIQQALHTSLYSEVLLGETETSDNNEDHDETTTPCPICLVEFDASDAVSSCKDKHCRHLFHKECLSEWLQKQPSCPCCRFDILRPLTVSSSLSSSTRPLFGNYYS